MIDHYSAIHYLYQYFYRKIYFNKKYKLDPTDLMLNHCSKFITFLDKKYKIENIGLNFLIYYFIFQFRYWTDLDIKTFSERIHLQFIIGKKAFQRWVDRDKNFDYQLVDNKFKRDYEISITEIKNFFKEDEDRISILKKEEELEKKRFFNLDKGLLNCIERTSLYNHKSQYCLTCKFKDNCKIILNTRYAKRETIK